MKTILALLLVGFLAGSALAQAPGADVEYFLSVDPVKPGVSVIAIEKATGKRVTIVSGAGSIDEAIREAMLRTGKPLLLKFGT